MNINIILGNTIDTCSWIKKLRAEGKTNIYVLDYDLTISKLNRNNVFFISTSYASNLIVNTKSVRYYKSLYIYPGIFNK